MASATGGRGLLSKLVAGGIVLGAVGVFALTSEDPVDTDIEAAVQACDAARVAAILDRGVSPDGARDGRGFLPLATAVARCQVDVVQVLLDGGAEPDHGYPGLSPLADAVVLGDEATVAALVDAGADVGWVGIEGDSLVARAVHQGHREVLDLLLAAGAPPDVARRFGGTPLLAAAARGDADVVATLLAAGADPNRSAAIGLVDLGQFVYSLPVDEQGQVVEVLGPVVGLDEELMAAFTPSASEDALGEVLPLIDAVDLTTMLGQVVPLYVAVVRDDVATVEALVAGGADPGLGFGPDRHSSLAAAEALGREELVALLGG